MRSPEPGTHKPSLSLHWQLRVSTGNGDARLVESHAPRSQHRHGEEGILSGVIGKGLSYSALEPPEASSCPVIHQHCPAGLPGKNESLGHLGRCDAGPGCSLLSQQLCLLGRPSAGFWLACSHPELLLPKSHPHHEGCKLACIRRAQLSPVGYEWWLGGCLSCCRRSLLSARLGRACWQARGCHYFSW